MKKSDKRKNEFTITIRGDSGNTPLTTKGEDEVFQVAIGKAIEDVFRSHKCRILSVFVDA